MGLTEMINMSKEKLNEVRNRVKGAKIRVFADYQHAVSQKGGCGDLTIIAETLRTRYFRKYKKGEVRKLGADGIWEDFIEKANNHLGEWG